MLTFHLTGELPLRFAEGIEALADELGFRFSKDGIPVKCKKGDALCAFCDGEKVELVWVEPVQFYRALSLIPEDLSPCSIEQRVCFKSIGVMFDMSRNAVSIIRRFRALEADTDAIFPIFKTTSRFLWDENLLQYYLSRKKSDKLHAHIVQSYCIFRPIWV